MSKIHIRRVLLSLADKNLLDSLLAGLAPFAIDVYSTGGTYSAISQWMEKNTSRLRLIRLETYLDYPEMPGGLVKTLHPRVHGGLLADLEDPDQREHVHQQGMVTFDMLAVNLYPFEATVARGASDEECLAQIDIGGVAMLRAGAKNFRRVAVLSRPEDYGAVLAEMTPSGDLSSATLRRLARIAFDQVLAYDKAICEFFARLEGAPC